MERLGLPYDDIAAQNVEDSRGAEEILQRPAVIPTKAPDHIPSLDKELAYSYSKRS
jgi:hypothetical protein